MKPKILKFAVSINWPNASPPLGGVIDMLRYSQATVMEWGQCDRMFYMNLEFRYTDTNLTHYLEIQQARWDSFGYMVYWNTEYRETGEGLELVAVTR